MAGVAQGDRARRDPGGCPSGYRIAVPAPASLPSIQAVAPSLRVEVIPVNVGDAAEIERAVAAFARAPNGGLIATGGGRVRFHRDLIIKLAARHKLPAVYYDRVFVVRRRPDLLWA